MMSRSALFTAELRQPLADPGQLPDDEPLTSP
jgi:hypothetical protein